MSRLLFTCLKNEGPFLLEWIAYHRALGFDAIVLFTNDCEDGTDAIADRLHSLGLATHIRNNPDPKRGVQWSALRSQALAPALQSAQWAMHLDVDEFLNIRNGGLDALIDASDGADAISIPWRFFGNADVSLFEDTPVVAQFTKCSPYPYHFPRQGMMFKTIYRPSERLDQPGIHAPRSSSGARVRWLNGDGRPVSQGFNPKSPLLIGPDAGNALAQINHYALRSRQSFLVKSLRGLPNHMDVPIDLKYWVLRNFVSESDAVLANRWPEVAPAYETLRADTELARLHNDACTWHRNTAEAVMQTREGAELYAATVVAGPTRPANRDETQRIYDAFRLVYGKKAKS
jgi:hypothetical protein